MDTPMWLDAYLTPWIDPAFIARFVTAHALAPTRAAWGLPAPDPAEIDPLLVPIGMVDGLPAFEVRFGSLKVTAATVGPVLRSLLIAGTLFPESVSFVDRQPHLMDNPGGAILDSNELAHRTAPQIAWMARGLFGDPGPAPWQRGGWVLRTGPNPEALAQIAEAKRLLDAALGPVDDYGDYRRVETGLPVIDPVAADQIDEVLRRDVHRRLVWLGQMEPGIDDADLASSVTFDHGVVALDAPETLTGLILLDWSEALHTGIGAGRCAECLRPMALSNQQDARARKGEAVYHPDCHVNHRLRYGRDYQRRRSAGGEEAGR